MTTSYERGRQVEYRIQRELEAVGYTTARAAGSKGKFDVLAWDTHNFRIIQAKSFIQRAGSFRDDVGQIRGISCPPNTRREFWIWKHRAGWQVKLLIGDRPEEDRILELAEIADEDKTNISPRVVGPDGNIDALYLRLPLTNPDEAPTPGDSSEARRRAFGTPITVTCVGTVEMRDVLRGVRDPLPQPRAGEILLGGVPASWEEEVRIRADEQKARNREEQSLASERYYEAQAHKLLQRVRGK